MSFSDFLGRKHEQKMEKYEKATNRIHGITTDKQLRAFISENKRRCFFAVVKTLGYCVLAYLGGWEFIKYFMGL